MNELQAITDLDEEYKIIIDKKEKVVTLRQICDLVCGGLVYNCSVVAKCVFFCSQCVDVNSLVYIYGKKFQMTILDLKDYKCLGTSSNDSRYIFTCILDKIIRCIYNLHFDVYLPTRIYMQISSIRHNNKHSYTYHASFSGFGTTDFKKVEWTNLSYEWDNIVYPGKIRELLQISNAFIRGMGIHYRKILYEIAARNGNNSLSRLAKNKLFDKNVLGIVFQFLPRNLNRCPSFGSTLGYMLKV